MRYKDVTTSRDISESKAFKDYIKMNPKSQDHSRNASKYIPSGLSLSDANILKVSEEIKNIFSL